MQYDIWKIFYYDNSNEKKTYSKSNSDNGYCFVILYFLYILFFFEIVRIPEGNKEI